MEKKKKIKIIIVITVLILIGGLGITYAFYSISSSQGVSNRFIAGCLKIDLTNENNTINLQNAYPITDEEGRELTPYSFTIENTCSIFAKYTITLEVLNESTLSANYVATMLNFNEIETLGSLEQVNPSTSEYKEAYVLNTGFLGSGESEDYTLRIWLDEDVTIDMDAMNKIFKTKVVVTAEQGSYSPIDYGFNTLHDAILANEYQVTELQTAIDKINAKQEPDFSNTAPIIEWQEIYETSNSTFSIVAPDPADVGSGKDYAVNLTETNVYVGLAKNYTFDSSSGNYNLSNFIYQDPSTIDFNSNNYYYCGFGSSINTSGKLQQNNSLGCPDMRQISGLESVEQATITGSDGTSYPGIRYTFRISKRFSQEELESDKSDKGLYIAEDDYGTSYYYRGSVKNNYVYFAGYYWRIIRINGDGSIRLVYQGKTADASGASASIGYSHYNTNNDRPLYVGYMYGDVNGTTLEEVNANINDSEIKTQIDTWYQKNLISYANYLADPGFCNDRSLSTRENNGNGIDSSKATYYAAADRYNNYTPTLKCLNTNNDLFTVSNELGNKALKYPIGLITLDELVYAGTKNLFLNKLIYLYSTSFWTMSPSIYINAANVYYLTITSYSYGVTGIVTTRPVINLRSDVTISGGTGRINDPFIVET